MIAQLQAFRESFAVLVDLPVLEFIHQHLHNGILDQVMPIITKFGDKGLFWIAVSLLLAAFPKTRKIGLSSLVALILGVLVCNVALKNLVQRPRPFVMNYLLGLDTEFSQIPGIIQSRLADWAIKPGKEGTMLNNLIASEEHFKAVQAAYLSKLNTWTLDRTALMDVKNLLVSVPDDYAFPSGHTIASFEACTVMLVKDKRIGIPATILAFAIAISRLYLFVHYPSDVIFSFFAGILLAFIGCGIVAIIYKVHPPKHGRYELTK